MSGVLICLRRFRRSPAAAFCLIWVGVMLLPTLLAEDTPHFLRAVGVWPALAFLPALGLEAGTDWLARRAPRFALPALTLILAASLGLTVRDYFVRTVCQPSSANSASAACSRASSESGWGMGYFSQTI